MDDEEIKILINKIISFNHAWKLASKQFGDKSEIAKCLRDQKACLQAELLRFNHGSFLRVDQDSSTEEELYSVRYNDEHLASGLLEKDAAHLPVRVAQKLFTTEELTQLVRD